MIICEHGLDAVLPLQLATMSGRMVGPAPASADANREPPRDHVISFTPWRNIKIAAVLAD